MKVTKRQLKWGTLGLAIVALAAAAWWFFPGVRRPLHIEANERAAERALLALAAAQEQFRWDDWDRNGIVDFWTGDIATLARYAIQMNSRNIKQFRDVWEELAAADPAPLCKDAPEPVPYKGYFFIAIAKDWEAKDLKTDTGDGKGAVHSNTRFAICAYPAEYGITGVNTMIISRGWLHRSTLHREDLGGKPRLHVPATAVPNEALGTYSSNEAGRTDTEGRSTSQWGGRNPVVEPLNELRFEPVVVGNGPLVCLRHPEKHDRGRAEMAYIFDPALHKKPHLLVGGPGQIQAFHARLNRNAFILECGSDKHYVVDLDKGRARPLLRTHRTELITVDGTKIFFRDMANGWIYVWHYGKSKGPKLLLDAWTDRVLAVRPNSFWILTGGKKPKLVRLYKDGRRQDIIDWNPSWLGICCLSEVSPKGRYLAMTITERHPYYSYLVVFDIKKHRIVRSVERLMIDPSYDSNRPILQPSWMDERTMYAWTYSSPFALDVVSGKIFRGDEARNLLRGKVKPNIGSRHWNETRGCFDLTFGRVYFRGKSEPVASVLDSGGTQVSDLAVSPDGNWAVFSSPVDFNTYLVDGPQRKKRILLEGWSYDIVWLPAVSSTDGKPNK